MLKSQKAKFLTGHQDFTKKVLQEIFLIEKFA